MGALIIGIGGEIPPIGMLHLTIELGGGCPACRPKMRSGIWAMIAWTLVQFWGRYWPIHLAFLTLDKLHEIG